MGKQVKNWAPPVDAVEEAATEPAWTPPADAVVEEPVKKKESQGLGGIDFVQQQRNQFAQPGQPEVEPSKASSPKSTGTNNWAAAAKTAEAIDPNFGRAVVDIARKVATGFADEIPQAAAQSKEVAKSFLKPASNAEYIQRVPVEFQNFVREKEGLKWYEPFEMNKYLDKYADQFMQETGRAKTAENIAAKRPELIKSRLETERYVQQQKNESAEKMSGATQSYKDIKNVSDFASYISTLGANALYQIPLSVATRGGSSLIQEAATIYDQRIDRISQEKGISREEVIKQGLDAPAEGQAYALLAASLDKMSAGNIISAFKKGGGQVVKKWASTAVPEAVTEPTQGVLENIGSGGNLKDAITSGDRIDEALGGLIGGSAGAINIGTDAKAVVSDALANTDPTSIEQAEVAAEQIDQALNTEENGLNVQPETNTERLSGTNVSTEQQGEQGAGVESSGDVLLPTDEQSNNETTDPGTETPKQKASREIDALVASGDVERDGKKVKILTEKGGQEVKRIYEELEKAKVQPAEKSLEQQVSKSTNSKTYEVKPVNLEKKGKNFDYNPGKNLTDTERQVENKFATYLDDNYQQVKSEYDKKYGNVLDADNVRDFSEDYISNPSENSNAIHSPSSSFLFKMYQEKLAEPAPEGKQNKVVFIGGGSGSGKSSIQFDNTSDAQIVYNTSMAPLQVAKNQINRALNAGKTVDINYVYRDPLSSFENGVVPRANETGRVVPISEIVRSHIGSRESIDKIQSEYAGDDKVNIKIYDNTGKKGEQKVVTADQLPAATDAKQLSDKLNSIADKLLSEGKISQSVYDQLKGGPSPSSQVKPDQPTPPPTQTGSAVLDQPEEKRVSGIKKALVPEDKVDATPVERRNMEGMLQRAKEQVDSGEVNPKAITDEIAKGNARALQPDEVSALVYYKTQIDNRADQLNVDLIDAIESGDQQAQARIRTELDAVNQEIDNYNTMAVKTAYEQSLAFNMRKMLLDNEYNLQTQVNKYKAANNGKISPEVEKKFKDLDAQLKEANAKLKKMEEKQSVAAATESLTAIRQSLQKQKEKRVQTAVQRKQKINEFFDKIKIKPDANKLNSITQVIGEQVYNGSIEAVRAAVLAGADVASAIQAGVDYVKEHYRGTDFDEDQYDSTLRPGLESLVPSEPDSKIPEMRDGKLYIPPSIIKKTIEDGAENISQVVMMVKDMIKDAYPEISNREIRDAITSYGTTRNMSKDEIDVKVREIKRVGRLISQLEDVQNKQRPLRSGLQRDKPNDEERRLQREIREGMKDIPVDPDEEARTWKNALDAIKSRLTNQIADLEKQIETGEKSPKKKGIEYDDEAKQLQERRDELKAIIQSMEGKPKISDEQRIRQAINATGKQIAELERRIKDKDTSKAPKTEAPTNQELQDLRKKRDDLRSAYTEMEKELGVADARKLDAIKKALRKSQEMYEQRLRDKDFTKKPKPAPTKLDEEATKLKLERDKIKQQFDLEQEKARLANRPWNEKAWDTAMDIWNLPKSFLASIDMSAPFRQGAILSVANPSAGAASFNEMFRQAFSEQKANEWLLKLRESPEYAVMKSAKLYIAEPTTKLTAKEENFISNLAGRVPIIGKAVSASERAYTGYLNKLRADVFINGADRLREQGITPENNPDAYKQWANFINNATGRGNLGGMEMAAPVLNGLFFSPRYVASRVNLLNPVAYAKMPAPVRKMAMKNMISYIGFGTLVLALASAAGADVEEDPRSSDFGKIKIGDTRYDIWAGFQQIIRLIAQVTTGQRKSTKTGEITELNKDKFPNETRADVALRFGRSKLSPSAGTLANALAGETIVGEDVTIQGELVKNVVPLYLQDIAGIYEEEGPTGLTKTMIPAFFGIGVQSYSGKSGLENKDIDIGSDIQNLNKRNKYDISQPTKSNLSESLDHEIDDDTMKQFMELRDKEIKRQFDRYKLRLESEKDSQIYDKLMDQIVKEAGRHAKYKIAREKGWRETAKEFNPGEPFRLRNYKKNEEGKVVPR